MHKENQRLMIFFVICVFRFPIFALNQSWPIPMLKRFVSLFLLFIFFISPLWSQDIKIMTYNIRYDDTKDSINGWAQRKHYVLKIMEESDAKIIGVQEALLHQMKDIDHAFVNYEYVGVARDDGYEHGEYSAIFYDTTLFKMIKNQTFWLSDMPERPSYGWDAAFKRICTAVLLKHIESHQEFWVFNTHFDHMGIQARKKSAELVLERIIQFNPDHLPTILMGDFNVTHFEKPYKTITKSLQDTHLASNEIKGRNIGTYNGFQEVFEPKSIDFIFTNQLNILFYTQIVDQLPNGNYPSDHFPILVELNLKSNKPISSSYPELK